jgi:CheY-like chemotaxis protein
MALGYRVLIIDDDPETLNLLEQYLQLAGYDSIAAENGEEGIALLNAKGADLILLDIQMPKKDGFATMSEIQAHATWKEIPVIFLSSFDRPNLKVKALEMGADDYVTKPFDRAELQARIKVALRRSSRFQKIEEAFHGDLTDVPLPILLQTMALGGKTAEVKIIDPAASIYVKQGQFAGARMGSFSDEDALQRLLFGARGSFEIEFDSPHCQDATPIKQIDEILLQMAPVIDEVTEELSSVIDPDTEVEIKDGSAMNGMATTVRTAAIKLPGKLSENSRHIVDAISSGRITQNISAP